MTIHMNINDKFIDQFNAFVNSLPENAIEINEIDNHSISFDLAKEKVSKAIKNIPLNKGVSIEKAFYEVVQN